MTMKCTYSLALWATLICAGWARADVEPVSDVLVQRAQSGELWLRSVRVNDYEVPAAYLVTGHSTGVATAVPAPFNRITNADNLDLSLFAGRNREDPPEWRITDLGGRSFYWDSNGENPDFFLFETNGNDDIDLRAILADGSLGQVVGVPRSTWGDTGLRIAGAVHKNQKIMGLSWSLTDLLDGQGRPLTSDQPIMGAQISSPGLDPACFCAVEAAVVNRAPQVDAGEDIALFVPETGAILSGAVSDDGWGEPNGYLLHQWSWLEGPGPVAFEPNAFGLAPAVTLLGGPGLYVLELTATDGALESTDQVTVYLQSAQAAGVVLINEILADSDPQGQEQGDWIELYNPGDQSVDVAGHFLTDDLDRPTAWRIPGGIPASTTIAPGAFLRIWAGAGLGAVLQTDFRLDKDGETVALYGPDGQTPLDTVAYGRLPAGISWGREPDGSDRWVTLAPSPGQSNVGQGLALVADIKFSVDRGFVTGPFEVSITCSTAGATIAYTTDGSLPTSAHGIRSPSPVTLTINTTTVLRAMAHKDGMQATNVDTQTYLFLGHVIRQPADIPGYPHPWTWLGGNAYDYHDYEMDPTIVDHPDYRAEIIDALLALPTLSITVEPSEFIRESGFYWGSGEAPCSVELIFPDDPQDNIQVNAGVEPHSHDRLKRSLRLNFRSRYGTAKLKTSLIQEGSLYGDSATDSFDRLILRGGNNRCWARIWNPDKTTYAIDQFYRDTQLALSGYGSRGAFVHLYINGLYWGLYNPVERTDHWFNAEYFGGDADDWFAIHHGSKGRPGFHGDSTRYQFLMNELITQDQTDAHTYALTSTYIDVENFCDYLLCTWWMGVGDWPGNNWYAGCRTDGAPLGSTPLRFFAWDGEWSWDASRAGGPGYVHPDFRKHKSGGKAPISQIWHALRQNDDFMMLLADRVYRHFFNGGPLTEAVARQRWLQINEQLRSAVVAESARWGDAMENQGQPTRTRNQDWQAEVNAIYEMIDGNSRQFLDHLRQQGYYPALDPPTFSQRGGAVQNGQPVSLTNPNGDGVIYYTTDGSDPRHSVETADGPLHLPYSCTVNARVLDGRTWSASNTATFALGPVGQNLRISEIMYHPPYNGSATDPNTEFIELANIGSEAVNLNLVQFSRGIGFVFPPYELAPRARVLVVKDAQAIAGKYGVGLPIVGQYQGSLSNSGERIELLDPMGDVLISFCYQDDWYRATDGRGYSLELSDPAAAIDLNHSDAWESSSVIGGTPGQ